MKRWVSGPILRLLEGKNSLKLQEIITDRELEIYLGGQLSVGIVPAFEDELTAALLLFDKVTLDFQEVEAITASGLESLLRLQHFSEERVDAVFLLKGVKPELMRTFQEIGFDQIMDIRALES